jgi:hypothetical protein
MRRNIQKVLNPNVILIKNQIIEKILEKFICTINNGTDFPTHLWDKPIMGRYLRLADFG